ncbi:hypothetical protein FH972_017388 [Carpinus fangiana]|uniref:Uncharacterized protein n=1 Tax=Carpinus fangiana TaxID=176857 RepID=A0A5N6RIT3_9ROSI|nr:hypothetical protein FH972_017388 [Carpinus fangiana]
MPANVGDELLRELATGVELNEDEEGGGRSRLSQGAPPLSPLERDRRLQRLARPVRSNYRRMRRGCGGLDLVQPVGREVKDRPPIGGGKASRRMDFEEGKMGLGILVVVEVKIEEERRG